MKSLSPILAGSVLNAGIILVAALAASPMCAIAASSHQAEKDTGLTSSAEQDEHAAQDAAAARRVPKPLKSAKNPGPATHKQHKVLHGRVKPEEFRTQPQPEVGFAEDTQQSGEH